jgi:hypothetical protein
MAPTPVPDSPTWLASCLDAHLRSQIVNDDARRVRDFARSTRSLTTESRINSRALREDSRALVAEGRQLKRHPEHPAQPA